VKLTVYGAGAVGLVVGARLARAGNEVAFLVRDPLVAARIAARGVRLEDPASGVAWSAPARAVARAEELPEEFCAGTILFCMRASQTAAAAQVLAPLAPHACVASLQNDLDNEEILAKHFRIVIGAPLRQTCTRTAPNEARAIGGGRVVLGRHPSGGGRVVLGRHPSGGEPELLALAGCMRAAGYEVGLSEEIALDRWLKLCVNLMSAPNALIRRPDHATEAFVEIKARLLEEARDTLAALGIEARSCDGRDRSLEQEIGWQRASLSRGESARALPIYNQVWAALRHGGPLEADAYHRRILDLAARAGLAAPVNARVLEILLRQAGRGAGPESVAASEILEL
jgi:2-dehydropantoate 2-reductase